jgi:hypothetical protein
MAHVTHGNRISYGDKKVELGADGLLKVCLEDNQGLERVYNIERPPTGEWQTLSVSEPISDWGRVGDAHGQYGHGFLNQHHTIELNCVSYPVHDECGAPRCIVASACSPSTLR